MTEKTMTTRKAAEYLGVSIFTMQRYIRDKRLPATLSSSSEKRISYEVLVKDVEELKQKRDNNDPAFRPGPNSKVGKGKALVYFPRSPKWGSEMTSVLSPEERAIILEWHANLKQIAPQQFEKELKEMSTK